MPTYKYEYLRYCTAILKIPTYFLIINFIMISIVDAACNCCVPPPSFPPPISAITLPLFPKPTRVNDCEIWFPVPIGDGLAVPIQIYNKSIIEHDHDCDGVVDRLDPDVDDNGIATVVDYVTTKESNGIYIDVLANDSDVDVGGYIDKNTLMIYRPPLHGVVQVTDGKIYYLPYSHYIGNDIFSYVVKDNDGMRSRPTSVTVHIQKRNSAPVAQDEFLSTNEDTPLQIKLKGSDADHDRLTYTVINNPSFGVLTGTTPHITYIPKRNFFGKDVLAYRVFDGKQSSRLAKITIDVLPVNDDPIANDDSVTIQERTSVSLNPLENDIDTDGNTSNLQIVSVSEPHYGVMLLQDNRVYYTSRSSSAMVDTMEYTIEDENGGRDTAVIKIRIVSENDAPVAYNQMIATDEDHSVSFDLNASDPDGDPVKYTLLNLALLPEHGSVSGTPPHLVYTPNPNYNGNDYIAFSVDDGKLDSAPAVITIVVHPLNDPPVADAGVDETGLRGDTFTLDGSASYDIDGNITHYLWQEGNMTIGTEKTLHRQFTITGQHRIRLTVTDDQNASDSNEKIITIESCSDGCVYPDPTATNPYQ